MGVRAYIMRRNFDLRTGAGLLACAFHLLATHGRTKRGEDKRPPCFARKLACALYSAANLLGEVRLEEKKAFWRSALRLSESIDPTPLDWRRASETLKLEHAELIEGIRGDDSVEHTESLYRTGVAVMKAASARHDQPLELLGFILIEIAETRCVYSSRSTLNRLSELRNALRSEDRYTGVRGHHIIFLNLTGARAPSEAKERGRAGARRQRRCPGPGSKEGNTWRVRIKDVKEKQIRLPGSSASFSKLNDPSVL
jgi:hypothetical protein